MSSTYTYEELLEGLAVLKNDFVQTGDTPAIDLLAQVINAIQRSAADNYLLSLADSLESERSDADAALEDTIYNGKFLF